LGLGSGLGGKATGISKLLGLELLRRNSELLGPSSQKLLLGLLGLSREWLGSELLGPSLLRLEELLGLLLRGKLGWGLTVQLWGETGSEGSEGSVLEGLSRG
jgi:hypothetical protein